MDILTYGLLNKKVEEAKNVSGEKITEAVNTYLDENPPTAGATAEQVAQIYKNISDISELKSDINNQREEYNSRCKRTYNEFDIYNYDIIDRLGIYLGKTEFRLLDTMIGIVIPVSVDVGKRLQFVSSKITDMNVIGAIAACLSYDYPSINSHYTQVIDTQYRPTSQRGTLYGNAIATNEAKYLFFMFQFNSLTSYAEKIEIVKEYLSDMVVVVMEGSDAVDYNKYPYVPHFIISVEEYNLSEEIIQKLNSKTEPTEKDAYGYIGSVDIGVGNNIVSESTNVTLTDVTGDYVSGYTFTTSNGIVEFDVTTTENLLYLIEFDMSKYAEGKIFASIGNSADVDAYFGGTSTQIVIKSDGGKLKIKNNSYASVITNVKCYPIVSNSDETVSFWAISTAKDSSPTIGKWNISIGGINTMRNNQNATRCIAIGECAMRRIVTGSRNIGIGTYALDELENGNRNVAIGADAMYTTTGGSDNVAVGKAALASKHTDAVGNVAIGSYAMDNSVVNAKNNVAVGYYAGHYSGIQNVYAGTRAGYFNKGSANVALGYQALNGVSNGDNNGEYNVAIGFRSQYSDASVSNTIVIGHDISADGNNQIVIGNNAIETVKIAGKIIHFNDDGTVTWSNE